MVTGHRMAFAVSPTRTVLWDQIQYSGSPATFAWVLPVGAGAYIELSNDAWFETLDAATTAQVLSPQYTVIRRRAATAAPATTAPATAAPRARTRAAARAA